MLLVVQQNRSLLHVFDKGIAYGQTTGQLAGLLQSWDVFATSTALLSVLIFILSVYLFNNVLTDIANACLEADLLSMNSKY